MEEIDLVVRREGEEVARWTVRLAARPARVTLDEVANAVLEARRLGFDVAFSGPGSHAVAALLGLGVEVLGQPEEGEQAGVEEVVVPDDPVA